MNKADLLFPKASNPVGKPYAIADLWEVDPRIACRELIQNSLDAHAALSHSNGNSSQSDPCRVSFKTSKLRADEIPQFCSYRHTLSRAKDSWKDNPSVSSYLKEIGKYSKRSEFDVLFIIDNGKGFDENGLESVLSEGAPEKQEGAAGAFGIGHLTAFGLSGLQYIFYLGKKADGSIISAGHAILSSYEDNNGKLRSNSGYFVKKHKGTFTSPFEFCDEADTPKFLLRESRRIEKTGSIVAILGFKGFRRKCNSDHDTYSAQIKEAVAENFAIAICSGHLEINVNMEGAGDSSIDQNKILGFLKWMARDDTGDRKMSKEAQWSLEAIETYQNPNKSGALPSDSGFQDCEILQRNGVKEHSISIWRNGMLITKRHIGLAKGMFDGKRPINAVIMLSGRNRPRAAHDIVKNAETPLHNRIQEKRLSSKKEKSTLKALLAKLREWIGGHAEDSAGSFAELNDEIVLDTGIAYRLRTPGSPRTLIDDDKVDDDAPDDREEDREPAGTGENNGDKQQGKGQGARGKRAVDKKNHIPVQIQGRRIGQQHRLGIMPLENAKEAILEILLDSGQDPSCVGVLASKDLHVSKAKQCVQLRSNEGVLRKSCRIENGRVILENLTKGMLVTVDLQFQTPLPNEVSLECRVGEYSKRKRAAAESNE